jgi:hypothetical protein
MSMENCSGVTYGSPPNFPSHFDAHPPTASHPGMTFSTQKFLLDWITAWFLFEIGGNVTYGCKMSILGGEQVVEMVGEVRGANKVDPGPIFRGPYAFWAELHLDSFLK